MWRSIASTFLTLLVVILITAAGLLGWAQREYSAEGPLEAAICLQVEPGSSMRRVAADLEASGAVSSGLIYRLGADYSGKADQLKAGSFLIEEGESMAEIVDQITGGGVSTCGTEVIYRVSVNGQEVRVRELDPGTQEFAVTAEFDPKAEEAPSEYSAAKDDVATRYRVIVAEGVTSWQVVEALKASDLMAGEIAALPDEGSLAPGSYEIRPGQDRAALLAEMQEIQTKRLADAWAARSADAPVDSPEEALILASIVEKETGVAEERPLVASVFANRMEQGIRLQTDPTVIYGITKGEGVLGRGLRQSELRRETPYNTYVIDGLPPTPIANPGLDAIAAALAPAETDFVYFVADCEGGHAFAKTLSEHNDNVAKWRACEKEQAGQ